jgi:hypothetical protein
VIDGRAEKDRPARRGEAHEKATVAGTNTTEQESKKARTEAAQIAFFIPSI